MKLWRIKHIETGLFYRPVTGSYSNKSNLHKTGKFYAKMPSLKHIMHGYHYKGKFIPTDRVLGSNSPSVEEIWTIEEVTR